MSMLPLPDISLVTTQDGNNFVVAWEWGPFKEIFICWSLNDYYIPVNCSINDLPFNVQGISISIVDALHHPQYTIHVSPGTACYVTALVRDRQGNVSAGTSDSCRAVWDRRLWYQITYRLKNIEHAEVDVEVSMECKMRVPSELPRFEARYTFGKDSYAPRSPYEGALAPLRLETSSYGHRRSAEGRVIKLKLSLYVPPEHRPARVAIFLPDLDRDHYQMIGLSDDRIGRTKRGKFLARTTSPDITQQQLGDINTLDSLLQDPDGLYRNLIDGKIAPDQEIEAIKRWLEVRPAATVERYQLLRARFTSLMVYKLLLEEELHDQPVSRFDALLTEADYQPEFYEAFFIIAEQLLTDTDFVSFSLKAIENAALPFAVRRLAIQSLRTQSLPLDTLLPYYQQWMYRNSVSPSDLRLLILHELETALVSVRLNNTVTVQRMVLSVVLSVFVPQDDLWLNAARVVAAWARHMGLSRLPNPRLDIETVHLQADVRSLLAKRIDRLVRKSDSLSSEQRAVLWEIAAFAAPEVLVRLPIPQEDTHWRIVLRTIQMVQPTDTNPRIFNWMASLLTPERERLRGDVLLAFDKLYCEEVSALSTALSDLIREAKQVDYRSLLAIIGRFRLWDIWTVPALKKVFVAYPELERNFLDAWEQTWHPAVVQWFVERLSDLLEHNPDAARRFCVCLKDRLAQAPPVYADLRDLVRRTIDLVDQEAKQVQLGEEIQQTAVHYSIVLTAPDTLERLYEALEHFERLQREAERAVEEQESRVQEIRRQREALNQAIRQAEQEQQNLMNQLGLNDLQRAQLEGEHRGIQDELAQLRAQRGQNITDTERATIDRSIADAETRRRNVTQQLRLHTGANAPSPALQAAQNRVNDLQRQRRDLEQIERDLSQRQRQRAQLDALQTLRRRLETWLDAAESNDAALREIDDERKRLIEQTRTIATAEPNLRKQAEAQRRAQTLAQQREVEDAWQPYQQERDLDAAFPLPHSADIIKDSGSPAQGTPRTEPKTKRKPISK